MPPGAVVVVYPAHVLLAIGCIALALVVLALLAAVLAAEKR